MLGIAELLTLFALTSVAIVARPGGIGPGWWALGAAVLAVVTGLVSPASALAGLGETTDALLFFGGLVMLTAALERAGMADMATSTVLRWARGRPRRVLAGSLLLTAAVTALFSNDAAALLVAPRLASLARGRGVSPVPLLLGTALVANAASLILPVSNPVNLIVLERDHLPLLSYLEVASPAALAAALVAGLAVYMLLRHRLPATIAAPPAPPAPPRFNGRLQLALAAVLAALLAADLLAAALGAAIGPPTAIGGLVAVVTLAVFDRGRARDAARGARWGLLPLVAGLAILAGGLEHSGTLAGLTANLLGAGSGPLPMVKVGAATAVISAAANNLPATFLVSSGLQAAGHLGALGLPVIAGADLGANLAPAGSLSTVIILGHRGNDRGWSPPWAHFSRLGWIVGPAGLVASLGLLGLGR